MVVKLESVEKQIAQLLEINDCVQVPDFGGFVLNRRNAVFGTHSHELLSPGKAITFNRNLQMNDGLLCSHISNAEKIPYIEAQLLLAEKVRDWKNILSSGHVLHLENIGTLQQDAAQKWQFSPFSLKNFDLQAYGLGALQLKPVEQQTYTQKLETKAKALPANRRVWLRRAVYTTSLAAMLLLGFFIVDKSGFKLSDFNTKPLAEVKKEENPIVENKQIPQENKEIPQDNIVAIEIDNATPEAETNNTNISQSKFYIIGGSFKTEKNATKFVSQLEKKGYKAEVLHNENGFFRVAYIEEADSIAADQHLQKIKIEENQAAWILKW